jgi:hypothetical protein
MAFMLAATGRLDAAFTAFEDLRRALVATHGSAADAELANLNRITGRLQLARPN